VCWLLLVVVRENLELSSLGDCPFFRTTHIRTVIFPVSPDSAGSASVSIFWVVYQ